MIIQNGSGLFGKGRLLPRLADPLIDRASAVILAHNHPVGALNPSEQDIETTQRLRQAGEIMGITILDHIIFNSAEYFIFLENDIGF